MGVDLGVAPGVVALDVQEVGRVPERRLVPVQVPKPRVHARVPGPDVAHVALEVLHVDGLSAGPGRVSLFFPPRSPSRLVSSRLRGEGRDLHRT